jgi:transposase
MEGKKGKRTRLPMQSYSEEFKRRVCAEYLATRVSKVSLLKKYNIRYRSAIQHWLRQYKYEDIGIKRPYLPPVNLLPLAAKEPDDNSAPATNQALGKRIKELERLLADEQLRSQAYHRMIEVAEKEFKLPIRKKFNTK